MVQALLLWHPRCRPHGQGAEQYFAQLSRGGGLAAPDTTQRHERDAICRPAALANHEKLGIHSPKCPASSG